MSNHVVLRSYITRRLQDDDNVLQTPDLDDALTTALHEYSTRFPRRRTHDLSGDGSTTTFNLPTDWEDRWSELLSIELPAGEDPAQFLERDQYRLELNDVSGTATLQLRFSWPPDAGKTARLRYTTVHTVTTQTTSVPSRHHRAIGLLGAAIAMQWIANQMAAQSDSTFGADTADHTGRSDRYAQRARELRARYDEFVPPRSYTRLEVTRV